MFDLQKWLGGIWAFGITDRGETIGMRVERLLPFCYVRRPRQLPRGASLDTVRRLWSAIPLPERTSGGGPPGLAQRGPPLPGQAHFRPRARSSWNCSTEIVMTMTNSATATVAAYPP